VAVPILLSECLRPRPSPTRVSLLVPRSFTSSGPSTAAVKAESLIRPAERHRCDRRNLMPYPKPSTFNSQLFGLCILLLGLAPGAWAATRTVTDLGDSGTGTLRTTIGAATAGDTIDFAISGTITLAT